jgi:hypothetical protein
MASVSGGLYDNKGLQYQDHSFEVLAIPALNADALGRPLRWSRGSTPSGFSDHFPILARLRVADSKLPSKSMPLSKPSIVDEDGGPPIGETSLSSRGSDKLIKLGLFGLRESNWGAWTTHGLQDSYFAYFVN